MKTISGRFTALKKVLTLSLVIFTAFQSNGQQSRATDSGYATVNGVKTYYEVYGEGRPVLLVHGAFYTIGMNWAELIPELSKTRKVIAIELQGHGHAPFSERKLNITTLATDVEGVLNHLKIDSADMVGYSMGGSIAYQFAVQYPKRLRNLVIISSTYKTSGWQPEVNNALDGMKPELFDNTPMKTAYDLVAPDKTKWTKFIEQMIHFAGESFDTGDSNIAKISSPVLLISGDNDGVDKMELMKTYKLLGGLQLADFTGVPKSQLAIVPAQGHVSLMMQTKTILEYVESFLK